MKATLALLVVMCVVFVSGMEAPKSRGNAPHQFMDDQPVPVADHGNRQRRVTCDLLSVDTPWGSLNHAACAAHCLAMLKGFRGGYCDGNGVCVCRR